ncbi:MAG: KEOPS complex subunit Pcc1 [Halobacteriota archaeon]|nr:KEOPS complex subunit Pcc1 [Halobacteriota archaeon]
MMDGKAEIDICLGDKADIVYNSIISEMDSTPSPRSKTVLNLRDGKLKINVLADDIVMLRATLNTWLRLVKISVDMNDVIIDLS